MGVRDVDGAAASYVILSTNNTGAIGCPGAPRSVSRWARLRGTGRRYGRAAEPSEKLGTPYALFS
jgi:hypothetical protein